MDAERCIATGNRVNGALVALMTYCRTQCSIGTDAVIRQRNMGITDEELKKDECCRDVMSL